MARVKVSGANRWLQQHPVQAGVAQVVSFGVLWFLLCAAMHVPFQWHVMLPTVIGYTALFALREQRNAAIERRSVARRAPVRDLSAAWAESWRLVLVETVALTLIVSLWWTIRSGLAVAVGFILGAIVVVPVFLCVVIVEVGGAFRTRA